MSDGDGRDNGTARAGGPDLTLVKLVEDLTEGIRRGVRPNVEALTRARPEYAEKLRRMIPTIEKMVELGEEAARHLGLEGQRHGNSPPVELEPSDPNATTCDESQFWSCPVETTDRAKADLGERPRTLCFGRYRVLRSLGRGTFGEVFLTQDDELKRLVAVKVQRAGRSAAIDADDFVREARLVARLDHLGIVPVYDVGHAPDGRCYIVSKYIEGMTLAHLLRRRRPRLEEAVGIVISVGEALQYAHDAGVVHRDLKPSNILIAADGETFLTDFGIALTSADDPASTLVGTPAYMSPEQARGASRRVDGRSDIFALGIVFYELLAGRHPFGQDDCRNPVQVLTRIKEEDPEPLRQRDKGIPPQYERICLKALSKSPEGRYSAPRELVDELRRATESRQLRRFRIIAVLLALATATALGLGIYAYSAGLGEGTEKRLARWVIESGGTVRTTHDSGTIIRDVAQLPATFRINYIDLGGNRGLHDEDIRRLLAARHLGSLDLNSTPITDRCLESVGRSPGLIELWLNQTAVTSDGLRYLEGLQYLVHLELSGTPVGDDGLKSVGKLSHLRFLGLSGTRVTDAGLAHLTTLTSLERLRLHKTVVTEAGVAKLMKNINLKYIDLNGKFVAVRGVESPRQKAPP